MSNCINIQLVKKYFKITPYFIFKQNLQNQLVNIILGASNCCQSFCLPFLSFLLMMMLLCRRIWRASCCLLRLLCGAQVFAMCLCIRAGLLAVLLSALGSFCGWVRGVSTKCTIMQPGELASNWKLLRQPQAANIFVLTLDLGYGSCLLSPPLSCRHVAFIVKFVATRTCY